MIGARRLGLGVALTIATVTAAPADARPRKADAAAPQARTKGPLARVLSETAQVYSGAGFSSRVIAQVERDDTVRMVERGKRGGWTRVQLDETKANLVAVTVHDRLVSVVAEDGTVLEGRAD